jgi:hypothetical protein
MLSPPILEPSCLSLSVAPECSLRPRIYLNAFTPHPRPTGPNVRCPVAPDYLPQSPAFTLTMIILNRRQVPPNGGLALVPKIPAPSEEQQQSSRTLRQLQLHVLHNLLVPVVGIRVLMKVVLKCAKGRMISKGTWSQKRTRRRHTNVWRVRGCLPARIL